MKKRTKLSPNSSSLIGLLTVNRHAHHSCYLPTSKCAIGSVTGTSSKHSFHLYKNFRKEVWLGFLTEEETDSQRDKLTCSRSP